MHSLQAPSRKYRPSTIFVWFIMLFASRWMFADAVGSGTGVVRDVSGAVVAGAKITLTRLSTNAVLTRVSDPSARISLSNSPPTYTPLRSSRRDSSAQRFRRLWSKSTRLQSSM